MKPKKVLPKQDDALGPWDQEDDIIDLEKSADFTNKEAQDLYQNSMVQTERPSRKSKIINLAQ